MQGAGSRPPGASRDYGNGAPARPGGRTFLPFGALVGVLAAACSSTPNNHAGASDGGSDGSGADASHDSGPIGDGSGCFPADVSTFVPPTYIPAKKLPGKCTPAQITNYYDACLAANATQATCAPFVSATATQANRDCAGCILSQDTATAYGALVLHKGTVSINLAGCMELTDGASGLSCAKAYQASDACGLAACTANCPVTDDASFQIFQACTRQADTNGCATYATAAMCTNAEQAADAGAAICFMGMTFQDLYNSVAPIFCGP